MSKSKNLSKSENTKTKRKTFRLSLVMSSKAKILRLVDRIPQQIKKLVSYVCFLYECIADLFKINPLGDYLMDFQREKDTTSF